ncbi:MAG: HU family DNA-binding protein, partial [Bacteroidales bacterium]
EEEMYKYIERNSGVSAVASKKVIRAFFKYVMLQVREFDIVNIMGLGRFYTKEREAYVTHIPDNDNPGKTKDIYVEAGRLIRFFPSDNFKDVVNYRIELNDFDDKMRRKQEALKVYRMTDPQILAEKEKREARRKIYNKKQLEKRRKERASARRERDKGKIKFNFNEKKDD